MKPTHSPTKNPTLSPSNYPTKAPTQSPSDTTATYVPGGLTVPCEQLKLSTGMACKPLTEKTSWLSLLMAPFLHIKCIERPMELEWYV